jgi:ubiquinone/menaquinone biosynthesis C-methylase UbiE
MEYVAFGPWLWRCRCAFLLDASRCRRAVAFGDGDGRFAAQLLKENPAVEVDAVDSSGAMLKALVRRAGRNASRLRTHAGDARQWQPGNSRYDLIVTHFFLDCLTTAEVRALAATLRGAAAPGALWIVSEFAKPRNWFGRVVAGPIVAALYAAFGMLTGLKVRTLPDHEAALREAGFQLEKKRVWLKGLLVGEAWRMAEKTDE